MTAAHAATLYFDGKSEAAKKRIQKLKVAGLIAERPRRVYQPSILFLTQAAFRLLSKEGHLAEYPKLKIGSLEGRAQVSERTLKHELEVMDVKAAMMPAVNAQPGFKVTEFSTWPLLYEFKVSPNAHASPIRVKPDGYVRVKEESAEGLFEHNFFLEVDRSSEAQGELAAKGGCYASYYRTGGFAERCGGKRDDYKDFPFRTLMVFRNVERRNNAAEALLRNDPPILSMVWLTTFEELTTNPLGAIWVRPIDYRDATAGTAFKVRNDRDRTYRRQCGQDIVFPSVMSFPRHPALRNFAKIDSRTRDGNQLDASVAIDKYGMD